MDLKQIRLETAEAVTGLLEAARLEPGEILVVGCSTSEVTGKKIGSAGSLEVAEAILEALLEAVQARQLYLAVQCCEHLNRALVVEKQCARDYALEEVSVIPVPRAGGSLAAMAMRRFKRPVVVEKISAHAGMDIGDTFIGMHLKRVAVPVRLAANRIGQAHVTFARTRPPLIGGARAVYVLEETTQSTMTIK